MSLMKNLISYDNFLVEKKKYHHPFHGSLTRKERNEFIKKLQKNIVVFRYMKRDGVKRKAEGTLHPDYLPPPKSDKEFIRPEYQIVYYDFDKKDWRSFRSFKFIEILSTRPVVSKREDDEEEKKLKEKEEETKKVKDESVEKDDKDVEKVEKQEDEKEDIDVRDEVEILKDKRKKKESDD